MFPLYARFLSLIHSSGQLVGLSRSLCMTGSKLDELYSSLERKNAEIYIKRSRQLYDSCNLNRRPLFSVRLTGSEIIALADPSMHGRENAIHHMTQIDPDR